VENSARMGAILLDSLQAMQKKQPGIGDVRGLGLMVAAEFTTAQGEPDTGAAKAVRVKCLEKALMLLTCGPYGNVIRWIPPLNVTREQLDESLEIFENALPA
jgi:4-aminobutyrate aminotransferase